MDLKGLVGSGDRIGLMTLPFMIIGLTLNFLAPSFFSVGGPPVGLQMLAGISLLVGVVIWIWSVALILMKVPRHELITNGPYSIVKHPLYTSVALLVIPSLGLLLNTWLGIVIGIVLYAASRIFEPEEERTLAKTFGTAWDEYDRRVKIAWL